MRIIKVEASNKIHYFDVDEINHISPIESNNSGIWFSICFKNREHIQIYLSNCENMNKKLCDLLTNIVSFWSNKDFI